MSKSKPEPGSKSGSGSKLARRFLIDAAIITVVTVLLLFLLPMLGVRFAKNEVPKPDAETHKKEALVELNEYVDLLQIRLRMADELVLLQVAYEDAGKKWELAGVERARKKALDLLKLHEIIERHAKILEKQYGDVVFPGEQEPLADHIGRQQEGLAKDRAASQKKK